MANCLKRLLGQCCCGCCAPQGWEERRVVGLAGRTALTRQGPVALRPGHHPRPGQTIVVTGAAQLDRGCAPAPVSGASAGATRQARSEIRPSDDDVLAVPPPDWDAWPRPVALGTTALTLPTLDGPLTVGTLPPGGATPGGQRALLSHVQGGRLLRPETLAYSGTRMLGNDEWEILPFTATQRVLTDTFPSVRTVVDYSTGIPFIREDGPYQPTDSAPRWRIAGPAAPLAGAYQGTELHLPLRRDQGSPSTAYPIQVPATPSTLAIEGLMWFRPEGGDTQEVYDAGGYWAVPDTATLLVLSGGEVEPGVHRLVSVLQWEHTRPGAEGQPVVHYAGAYDSGDGPLRTVWQGEVGNGYALGVRVLDSGTGPHASLIGRTTTEKPGTVLERWPIRRLVWSRRDLPELRDPNPFDHQYEAELRGVGRVEAGARPGTVSTGDHLDHPRTQDGAVLRLNGEGLPCTSWAVLARRGETGEELGLLTCDGSTLTARWPGAEAAEVPLTALLGGLLEEGEAVAGALLESEFDLVGQPDNVRLVWGGGQRAALLLPWDPWRDWTRKDWQKAGKSRPRILEVWTKVPRSRWPTPPPSGLSVAGEITPPPPDALGLPRYGREPAVVYALAPFGARWPWAERARLQEPDERLKVKPKKPDTLALPPIGGSTRIVVARVSGRLPSGARWIGPETKRWGLRMLASDGPPVLTRNRVQHLAVYALESGGGNS